MKAHCIHDYPAELDQARAMQVMIMNNLDPAVAQFPHELITYGGNGAVFSNWAQYHLVMKYLSSITATQTLVLNSGHPLGYASIFSRRNFLTLLLAFISVEGHQTSSNLVLTLIYSLFPSHANAPRVIISNGQLIPHFSTKADFERMYAMGNTIYGQMTAGSWCCTSSRPPFSFPLIEDQNYLN
jgi:urocanate hydratase